MRTHLRAGVLASLLLGVALGFVSGFSGPSEASRAASGAYSLPSGNPVTTGTTITSTWANTTLSDLGSEITNSLDRQGRGAMLAPLQLSSGTSSAPSLTFSSETTSGLYRAGSNDVRMQVASTNVQRWSNTAATFPLSVVTQAGISATNSTAAGAAGTFTGNSAGGVGISASGGAGAAGISATGGSASHGGVFTGGATSGIGVVATGTGNYGMQATGGANFAGVRGVGTALGDGVQGQGGENGRGGVFLGGASGAVGVQATGAVASAGVYAQGGSSSGSGVEAFGGTNGMGVLALGNGTGLGADITGGATASAGLNVAHGTAATGGTRQDAVVVENGDIDMTGVTNPDATTAVSKTLTPKNMVHAWANITTDAAGGVTINDGFNVASAAISGDNVELAIAADFASTNAACATQMQVSLKAAIGRVDVSAVGHVIISAVNHDGTTIDFGAEPAEIHIICVGAQ